VLSTLLVSADSQTNYSSCYQNGGLLGKARISLEKCRKSSKHW